MLYIKLNSISNSHSRLTLFGAATAGVLGSLALAGAPKAEAITTYNFTALGFLPGGVLSEAAGINDSGTVVGSAETATSYTNAFSYSNGTMTDLGILPQTSSSYATGINDSGMVVGYAEAISTGYRQAFSYSNGTMTDLGTFPGGTWSRANAINDLGTVVGFAITSNGANNAFSYSNGTMTNLGTLPGAEGSSAYAINDSGTVVGQSGGAAFSYTTAGGMKNLGTLGGSSTFARGINDSGEVVGSSNGNAFSHTTAGGMINLGTLPGGGGYCAYGINDSGTIVGQADTVSQGYVAFVYSNGIMSNLNTLTVNLPHGWDLYSANAINSMGDIVGFGIYSSDRYEAYLLTPIPEPASLALLAMGGLGLMVRGRKKKA